MTTLSGSGPSSKVQRFLWPEGHANDASAPWISQRWRAILWWSLVTFSAVDVAYPIPALTGAWWCAFFVLWVTPWRRPIYSGVPQAQIIAWLSSMLLFSWLIYRTQTAIREPLVTWLVFASAPWLKLVSFPMQTTLAAILTAALIAIPVRRIVGEQATAFAVTASIPYVLISQADTVFVLSRWAEKPLVNAICLYDAVMPMLVIGGLPSLLARFPTRAENSGGYVGALLKGKMNAGAALFGLYGGAIVVVGWGILAWARYDEMQNRSPIALVIHALILPTVAFVATMAAVVAWRSLARAARGHHVIIGKAAALGRTVLFVVTIAILSATTLVVAPKSGADLSKAIQLMPGPNWSIKYTTTPGSLRISGEFQAGVSSALGKVLARDPSVRQLELESSGGLMDEGLAIAALVEAHGLSTFVRHHCNSACTDAFLAGRQRLIAPGAKLGFHRARSPLWYHALDDDAPNDQLIDYLKSKGIKEDFARKALQVPYEDMWFPSEDELLTAGVISTKPRLLSH